MSGSFIGDSFFNNNSSIDELFINRGGSPQQDTEDYFWTSGVPALGTFSLSGGVFTLSIKNVGAGFTVVNDIQTSLFDELYIYILTTNNVVSPSTGAVLTNVQVDSQLVTSSMSAYGPSSFAGFSVGNLADINQFSVGFGAQFDYAGGLPVLDNDIQVSIAGHRIVPEPSVAVFFVGTAIFFLTIGRRR
jgi:hypothetical protein